MTTPTLRRSLLFVPGSEQRRIDKALQCPTDTIIFDLEDAVALEQKAGARELVAAALQANDFQQVEAAVRVNPPRTPWFAEDLSAMVESGAKTIVIPKCADLEILSDIANGLPNDVQILALIETPLGILNLPQLASAPQLSALCFGHVDFSTEMGLAEANANHGAVWHARCQLAIAAKAYGLTPIDNICLAIKDDAAIQQDIQAGIDLGYEGKLCIHPRQVEWANKLYSPTDSQIEFAQRVMAAAAEAQAAGQGVFTINNKMIDAPVITAQQNILLRAQKAGLID